MSSTNYIQDDTGNTYIPPSQRPDGTWRRAIRVKDGYVPQEEQPLYVSRGRQSTDNNRTAGYPVGLSPEDFKSNSGTGSGSTKQIQSSLYFEIGKYEPITKIPGLNFVQDSSSTQPKADDKKSTNAKKKKKSKGSKSNDEIIISEPFTPATKKNLMPAAVSLPPAPIKSKSQQENVQSSGANNINTQIQAQGSDPVKRLRNLKKKLKDIESLEQKIKSGELKNPDKDQLDKIHRKDEVVDQIDELAAIVESLNLS